MKIILYSTNCPKCKVLESKLKSRNIQFDVITDIDVIRKTGYTEAPILEIQSDKDVRRLLFTDAVQFINTI